MNPSTTPDTSPQASTAQAEAASGPPPRRRLGGLRRILSSVFGRVADYGRRYMQASVVHELREVQGSLGAISAELAAMREHLGQVSREQGEIARALSGRLAVVSGRTEAMEVQVGALQLQGDRIEILATRIDAIGQRAANAAESIPVLFGPRFDEIEIKQRPLIAYDDESMAIRMRDGYVMAPRNLPTFVTMLANATSKGLEPGTGDVLRRLVRPDMVVADVGANIGMLTLVMAWATGPTGRVYAFEPEAVPRSNLEKMKYLNGLSWVEVRDQAVGAEAGQLTFHVSDIIGHSSLYALPETEGSREIQVEVVRLDDVAPAKRMDVVKIDVEGAELDVLAGMSGLIARNKDLAIVAEFGPEHLKRVGQTPAQWFKAFADAGFKPYMIDEATGAAAPTNAKAAAKVISANIAFVRAGGDAEKRLLQR